MRSPTGQPTMRAWIRKNRKDFPNTTKEQEQIGSFHDEVLLSCAVDVCPNNGKDVFVDVVILDDKALFYVNAYGSPICEHMWKQANEELGYQIEQIHESAKLRWCPQCIKRIPKSSTVCPECGSILDSIR